MRLILSEPLPLEPSREGEKEVIELTAALNGASHRTIRTSYTTTTECAQSWRCLLSS